MKRRDQQPNLRIPTPHTTLSRIRKPHLEKRSFTLLLPPRVDCRRWIGFGLYTLLFTQPKQFGPVRMTALTTGGKINDEDINGQLSISPDGKYVVCAANDSKQQASLWIRQVSTNSLMRIVPPETGAYLATTFSPDGEMIYYVAVLERNNFVPTLYRVPVLGGTPAKILDRVFSAVGFSRDGSQFAFVRRNQEDMALMVANTDGSGEPQSDSGRQTAARILYLDHRGRLTESGSLSACFTELAPGTRQSWKSQSKVVILNRSVLRNGPASVE